MNTLLQRAKQHPVGAALVVAAAIGVLVLSQGLWQLRSSVARYHDYWSVPRGAAGGWRYVALGDSAAQGIGASSIGTGYVSVLAHRLQSLTGQPVQVVNLSKSGARIDDVVRDQLPQLVHLQADFITVDVGSNDIGDWNRVRFARSAKALCSRLPTAVTVVADVPSFMHGRWADTSREATDILRQECAVHAVRMAPLYASLYSQGWVGMFTLYAADGFHPNDRGHRVWADAFWQPLSEIAHLRGNACRGPSSCR